MTGIIVPSGESTKKVEKRLGLSKWDLANMGWDYIRDIDVPDLTLREKLHIDSMLPKSSAKRIAKSIKFTFDNDERVSLTLIENYKIFYRYASFFSKIST